MGKFSPSAFLHICDYTRYILTERSAPTYYKERTFFYDSKGRTVQVKETGSDGWTSRYSSSYDFTGNLTSYVERHFYGSHEDCVKYVYQYDLRGRKTLARRWLNGREFTPVHYFHDDLGRVIDATEVGGSTEAMEYDANGNILAASRRNGSSSATRTYFTHSGNSLQKVTENNRPWSFTY